MSETSAGIKRSRRYFSNRRSFGFTVGMAAGVIGYLFLFAPQNAALHRLGPMTIGHETLSCDVCHEPADGSVRQQIQANVRYSLGLRSSQVDFGMREIGSEVCLDCHHRANERHPIYRFNEPRFAEVRQQLAPQHCTSCHAEHRGRRVSNTDMTFCRHCHEKTRLKEDPLDVSHETLIKDERWSTCLGCHDFHGNHWMKTARSTDAILPPEKILSYFEGSTSSPYSSEKRYKAKKEVE